MTGTLTLMLSVSLFLGMAGLAAFIWAFKSGQFEDEEKFTHGLLFDGEDELNAARDMEIKKAELEKKRSTEESDNK
jgi:cbb3-type cytochrome oxidase maturation protein